MSKCSLISLAFLEASGGSIVEFWGKTLLEIGFDGDKVSLLTFGVTFDYRQVAQLPRNRIQPPLPK